MKRICFSHLMIVVLLASIFHLLALPVRAYGPDANPDPWTGKVWTGNKLHERTFNVPEDAVEVEVQAEWKWEGRPNQNQRNEKHKVEINGRHTIHCDDYGDEEYDRNNDSIGDEWVRCGAVKLEGADDLNIKIEFAGDNSSAGSHLFQVTVTWKLEPPVTGSVSVTKINKLGQPWEGVVVKLYQTDGTLVSSGTTPAHFENLKLGSYYLEEVVPAGSEPISPTRFDFTLTEQHLHIDIQFQNRRPNSPICNVLYVTPKKGNAPLTVTAISGTGRFDKIDWDDGHQELLDEGLVTGKSQANHIYTKPGRYYVTAWIIADDITTLACAEVIVEKRSIPTTGQYQDFTGPVAFGTFTPYLEPGKEHFDMTRSIMYNVEYINGSQGEIIYRFNGQEIDHVTSSLFWEGSFRQVESANGRAVTTLDEGVTKLIAYRYGVEQARIFQTLLPGGNRWIRPLDQPFEHKYQFELELHGPQAATDLLVYGDKVREIRYDENGLAIVQLTYAEPGLAAIYLLDEAKEVSWVTVASLTYPITTSQVVSYDFEEIGLYHYRVVDGTGQIVASGSSPQATFEAQPGMAYQAQLVYPVTSLFVGLYDDMKFKHPDTWLMPIDGRLEHAFEFHLDYHRLADPDLGNDHIRGEVVVDALYLTNGTTSVAQQFPYGRHDGALPGVTIVGIPTVSMVAFCQRPGFHEVAYWGGWENESYYLPERSWIFDQTLAEEWTEDQRGDCIDAAHRVNMLLARAGLRTDHTYRHHGERSQGYQMTQLKIWSPYNLVGMRPPHLGQLLKPGIILPYYESPEDMLFWGWDLDKGGLADGIGEAELKQHVASLGPVIYSDQTGIHPAEVLN